jgi:hypothetical protein
MNILSVSVGSHPRLHCFRSRSITTRTARYLLRLAVIFLILFFVVSHYFIDLLPRHFHFRRDRLFGELGSDFQSPLILADLAQYESPLAVPGRIRSPPSAALPACPYLTVFFRPVVGLVTILVNLFSITFSLLFWLIRGSPSQLVLSCCQLCSSSRHSLMQSVCV